MKILYLTKWDIDESSGVYKKIISQQKALERLGHKCNVLFVGDTSNAFLDIGNKSVSSVNIDDDFCDETTKEYDCCYVRFELLRHKFYRMVLKSCKKKAVPIILEIPTFPPYEESVARAKSKLKSHNFLGAIKTYLGVAIVKSDMYKQIKMASLVCNNGDGTVFKSTRTIRIENGIDFDSNPYINRGNKKEDDVINIIAVSNFSVWNGYDLAIEGLNNYCKKTGRKNIRLTFVGDKKKANDLIELTKKYNLDDLIEFTGLLGGQDLNSAYSKADVALGGLADHRRKAFTNSSLKAKEYAARGLIMILSKSEGIEDEIKNSSFLVEAEEKPVDFEHFLEWYRRINACHISDFIHSFSVKNYSWDVQMKYVCDEFKKVCTINGQDCK